MSSINTLISLLLLTSWSYEFEDCGSDPDSLISVSVSNCDENEKCVLKKGQDTSIEITFSNVDSDTLTAKVYGIIFGLSVGFPLPNPDGCKNSGIDCPINAGETYTYQNSLYVDPSYPSVQVDIQWELIDDDENKIACIIIPAVIR